jgi:hypothetical protein
VSDSELSTAGVGTLTAGLISATLFSTAGFGYLAFRRRDRRDARRVDATLIPSLSSRAAGLSWVVRY